MTWIMRAAAMARLARSMAPRLRDIHPVSALRPEEDVLLFRDTGILAVPVTAPGYLGWLQATDPTPGYRTYRRHLQALLADRPGRRPVLKSPFHLGRLAALLAEVPEATVAGLLGHRAGPGAGGQDDRRPGPLPRRGLRGAGGRPPRRGGAAVCRLGLELSGAARQRMRRWIVRHHHRGRGRPHRYCLGNFGLDPAVVDQRFARYREWVVAATSGQSPLREFMDRA